MEHWYQTEKELLSVERKLNRWLFFFKVNETVAQVEMFILYKTLQTNIYRYTNR